MKFLTNLREKLNPKQEALFKLATWTCLLVWMIFFFTFSIVMASKFASIAPDIFGDDTWGQILSWILPIWVVFTALLTIVLIARWTSRRLRGEIEIVEEEEEEEMDTRLPIKEVKELKRIKKNTKEI